MTKINLFFGKIDKPYSPGAIYHETGKLERDKMIDFNHDKINPTTASLRWLQAQLTTSPLPSSILGRLTFLVAASLLADNRVRESALKRLEISMIDSNQYVAKADPLSGDIESATNICLSNLLLAVRRAVLDIGAYNRDAER